VRATNYGSLCLYFTGEYLRPATRAEWMDSMEAETRNIGSGSGVINIGGQSVYVVGGPRPPRKRGRPPLDGLAAGEIVKLRVTRKRKAAWVSHAQTKHQTLTQSITDVMDSAVEGG